MIDLLYKLLKEPASQTTALWLLVALQVLLYRNQFRLFARTDDLEQRVSEVRGAHDFATVLHGCPMRGITELLDRCPLLENVGIHQRAGDPVPHFHRRKRESEKRTEIQGGGE